jgi:hypothetical protein
MKGRRGREEEEETETKGSRATYIHMRTKKIRGKKKGGKDASYYSDGDDADDESSAKAIGSATSQSCADTEEGERHTQMLIV